MFNIISIFVLSLFLTNKVKSQTTCEQSKILECTASLKNGPFANMGVLGGPVNSSALNSTCKDLQGVRMCLADKAGMCSKIDLAGTNDLIESINYICTNGSEGLAKFQSCMYRASYLTTFYSCYERVVSVLTDYNVQGQICKQNNGVYSCYVNASMVCDSEEFVANYYKLANRILGITYNCNINYKNWNTTQVYSECNSAKLVNCTQEFFSRPVLISDILTYEDTALTNYCNKYTDTIKCLNETAKCNNSNDATFFIFNYIDYICNVERKAFTNIQQCIKSNGKIFQMCPLLMNIDCSSMNSVHACYVSASKKYCNDNYFIQNLFFIQLQYYSKMINCELDLKMISSNTTDTNMGPCNTSKIMECTASLKESPFANLGVLGNFANMSLLATTCRDLQVIRKCISDKAGMCNKFDLAGTNDLIESINYICTNGSEGLVKFQKCMESTIYPTSFYACYQNVVASGIDYNVPSQICKQNNGVYSCYVNASKICDSEEFVANYYKLATGIMSLTYNCSINYKNWNTTQVYSECNINKYIECTQEFLRTRLQITLTDLITFDDSRLSNSCSNYANTMKCVNETAKCNDYKDETTLVFNSTNYICNVERKAFTNMLQCVKSNSTLFLMCPPLMINDCRSINMYHSCLVSASNKYCNDSYFMQNMIYLEMQYYTKKINCQLDLKMISAKNTTNENKQPCDTSKITECTSTLKNSPFANMGILGSPANMSLLMTTCRLVQEASKCIADKAGMCSKFDLASTRDLIESINFICTNGSDGLIKFQNCWYRQTYLSSFYACFEAVNAVTIDVNVPGQICKQGNGVYSCYVNASKVCDSEEFVEDYYKLATGVLSIFYNCTIDYKNWNTTQEYSQCNTAKSMNCTQDFIKKSLQITFADLFTYDDNTIANYCSNYTNTIKCVNETAKCNSYGEDSFSVLNTSNYICNERKALSNMLQCMKTNSNRFQMCALLASYECRSINMYHECLVSVSKSYCNDKYFVQNFFYLVAQPYTKMLNCELDLKMISDNTTGNNSGCMPPKCDMLCGFGNKKDSKGCDICECINPCETANCPPNTKCRVEDVPCGNPCQPVIKCYPIIRI